MKYTNFKTLALMLSASALLTFTGCGSDGTPSDSGFGNTTPPTVTPPAGTLPPTEPAPGELGYQTILADGTIDYVDYLGKIRNAPASAADAEYHTGTGYGSTVLDSPKNKCQNCHNELYDTWESSMHGKSWTDPIFQSKFQDFLRTQINKVGSNPVGDKLYTTGTLAKVAQTCIKCHAPGAFYAGDFKATPTLLQAAATTDHLDAAKISDQYNLATPTSTYDPTQEAAVVAVSASDGNLYKLTYQIGHESNREGITCAFCHSVETPRLMKAGDTYTLKADMRSGANGPIIRLKDEVLKQDNNASSQDMNNFFRLWGPEKPADYANTNKGDDNVATRASDGRYTMTSVNLNGVNGKTHYTGGPFYGPYGVSGKSNENADDETDRIALINPHFNADTNNHFGDKEIRVDEAGDHAKSLCLTCHQRSAGAKTSNGMFMELCSTQMAVTTGGDTAINDTLSSPKCQKCHMERIEGVLLHKWARPDLRFEAESFKAAVGYDLTPQLDEKDTTIPAGDNPQRDGWFNSHAFLGASKTGHKTSATAKIQSGFYASIVTDVSADGKTLTVKTTFTNKTAHMFPGAHPMRRVLSRLIVTDSSGAMLPVASSLGLSTFTDIENNVQPLQGKTLHASALSPVPVDDVGSDTLNFPGKSGDLNGPVTSQKFDMTPVIIPGTDTTLTNQTVSGSGKTTGTVANSAIVNSGDITNFTRVYGHETGKMYDLVPDPLNEKDTFVVRPGFDSNTVASDNRLSPNETETYTLTYNIDGKTGVSATYKIYYMQKGANGKFLVDSATGFLDQAASDTKKLLVTEVFTDTK